MKTAPMLRYQASPKNRSDRATFVPTAPTLV